LVFGVLSVDAMASTMGSRSFSLQGASLLWQDDDSNASADHATVSKEIFALAQQLLEANKTHAPRQPQRCATPQLKDVSFELEYARFSE
jgi:hypothetical protein